MEWLFITLKIMSKPNTGKHITTGRGTIHRLIEVRFCAGNPRGPHALAKWRQMTRAQIPKLMSSARVSFLGAEKREKPRFNMVTGNNRRRHKRQYRCQNEQV